MGKYCTYFWACCVAMLVLCTTPNAQCPATFNVMNYGAVGDGVHDDTQAFADAWRATCGEKAECATLTIPTKTFLLKQITFEGPCQSSSINVQFNAVILAPEDPKEWDTKDITRWLTFRNITGLNIIGFGQLNGRGHLWWDLQCKHTTRPGCLVVAPTALRIEHCDNVIVSNIASLNSPQGHMIIDTCVNVTCTDLNLTAPGNCPNCDGFHISGSTNVSLHHATIGTGDDCVSIEDLTNNVNITNIICGPGHGISIGSLKGQVGLEADVENIHVKQVHFHDTSNGARIKTRPGGIGKVQHISFTNMTFSNVQNPIIIDQYYGTLNSACQQEGCGVHISDVTFQNATGTSSTEVAIKLNCGTTNPCTDIILDNIQLTSAIAGKAAVAQCNNAFGAARGTVEPQSCLQAQ